MCANVRANLYVPVCVHRYVYELMVNPDWYRHGLATHLMGLAEDMVRGSLAQRAFTLYAISALCYVAPAQHQQGLLTSSCMRGW